MYNPIKNVMSNTRNGTNLLGTLGIVFIVLKLVGAITWSWWWVTLPFWGGIAIALLIMLVILIAHILSP